MFLSDALCLVSDHLHVDIFRLSVCNSTVASDYVLTKVSNILQLLLLKRLNLSCYWLMIVLMTVSNFFLLMNKELFARLKSPTTFPGLAKVAIFTTNVDAENQTLINHKCVCGALNRHFCQTCVMVFVLLLSSVVLSFYFVVVRWLGSSFAVFCLALCVWKNCKCATK